MQGSDRLIVHSGEGRPTLEDSGITRRDVAQWDLRINFGRTFPIRRGGGAVAFWNCMGWVLSYLEVSRVGIIDRGLCPLALLEGFLKRLVLPSSR